MANSLEYRPIRQTSEELDYISVLLREVDLTSFKPDGSFSTPNGTRLWSHRLLGVASKPGIRFAVTGSILTRHLSVFIEGAPQRAIPHPIRVIHPEDARLVESREENLRVGILGYTIGKDKEIADELTAEINSEDEDFFVEGLHDIWTKVSLQYHPQRVTRLILEPSETQRFLPDARNFVVIGERYQILPVTLRYVKKATSLTPLVST